MKKTVYLILLTLLLASNCKNKETKEPSEGSIGIEENISAIKVEAVVLKTDEFSKELSANGKITASHKIEVRTRLNEPIIQLRVKNGQWVKEGELIALLDTFDLYHNFVKEQLKYEKALLDFSDILLGQGYNINNTEAIPKEQFKNAKMRSGINTAKTNLELAKDQYQKAFIKAPVSGQIANISVAEGNFVIGNGFICTIIDNENLLVDFFILEEEASIVYNGLNIDVSPFYNELLKVSGKITAINPTVDNGLILVRACLNTFNQSLYDGVTVKIFVKSKSKTCLAVPKEAIVLRTGKKVIFTYNAKDKTARWNYVKTFEENSTHIEVTEGLKDNDTVIVSGNLHLGHDVPCTISNLLINND